MDEPRFDIERYQGVVESGPGPGEVVYHATVWHTNSSGNKSKNGFVFHAKPDTTFAELQLVASEKWAELNQLKPSL